jgi:hypothetical protein
MIDRQIDSPIPTPLVFVAQNASKTRSRFAGLMPGPESQTATTAPVASCSVLINNSRVPASTEPIASTAKIHFDGLKMVIGGSELSKTLAKQALAAEIDVWASYGMSETGPLVAAAHDAPEIVLTELNPHLSCPAKMRGI